MLTPIFHLINELELYISIVAQMSYYIIVGPREVCDFLRNSPMFFCQKCSVGYCAATTRGLFTETSDVGEENMSSEMSHLVIFVNMRNTYSSTFLCIGLSEFRWYMSWIFCEDVPYTRELHDMDIICCVMCDSILMKLRKINISRTVSILSSFHDAIWSLDKYLMESFIPESTKMKIA